MISNDQQLRDPATQLSQLLPPTPAPSSELWIEASLRHDGIPPPSYDASVADLPPDYTATDALATAQTPEYTPFPSLNASLCSDVPYCLLISRNTSPTSSLLIDDKSLYADIDFGFTDDGVRSHAKKKKPTAKKPAAASNAFDEPAKDEEPPPPAESPGGGDPPADGGGAGGGGDGGDGGDGDKDKDKDKDKADDDLDGWGDAAPKKKKKTKKQAQEEEAERLKKEEEEAAAKAAEEEAERVKKEEEEAAAAAAAEAEKAAAAPDLSWANDTPPADDWTGLGVTSKKKKKKGKVRRFGYLLMTYGRALTNADG